MSKDDYYFGTILDALEEVVKNKDLFLKREKLADKVDQLDRKKAINEKALADLQDALANAKANLDEVERQAGKTVATAEADAKQLLVGAEERSARIQSDARAKAESIISAAASRAAEIENALQGAHKAIQGLTH